ncbi:hypothetical protein I6A84_41255 [Frankia sp. CNm7]|uniref:Amidohydrolase n=1 Tax=Frankia nepalensis TaxID=1836974 RepID=A0A937RK72_9ACTN|nr:hypothetical protein [Frankia nepalensis]MBL7500210.1 hypothetical protein [Frankia nepalensis]MBL7514615.1 hypothetical protein [Frankia nepalensis]MBL7524299.1 hypothetical protein [Frankia nepalensis]MBL7631672.1 hypothetical protein [Frankia nepalensis]
MNAEAMILVSVDDHLVEPPSVFEGQFPARFTDAVPKAVRNAEEGTR